MSDNNVEAIKPIIAPGAGASSRKRSPRLSRADRSPLGVWFWEIDRVLLLLIAVLIAIGLVAVAAASPVSAMKQSTTSETIAPLYYLYRQIAWVVVGVPVMLVISMLPKDQARRFGIYGTIVFLGLLFLVPIFGNEVNGSQRWLGSGMFRLQPSEFLKPFFIITSAWILSWKIHDKTLPVVPLSIALTGVVAILLMMQPDLGQTIIFCASWMVLMLVAGLSFRIVGILAGLGVAGIITAYFTYSVAYNRINIWLFSKGDDFQVVKAHAALTGGGLSGTGPGAGVAKFQLPEAHTDYIFSVIGEEFGLMACIAIACIYLAVVVRVLIRLLDEEDQFTILAVAGLVTQFGGQAIINMAVNTQLFPSKGMTLPFISYGGSSMLALCVGTGLLLSLTRRNPYLVRSRHVVKWNRQ